MLDSIDNQPSPDHEISNLFIVKDHNQVRLGQFLFLDLLLAHHPSNIYQIEQRQELHKDRGILGDKYSFENGLFRVDISADAMYNNAKGAFPDIDIHTKGVDPAVLSGELIHVIYYSYKKDNITTSKHSHHKKASVGNCGILYGLDSKISSINDLIWGSSYQVNNISIRTLQVDLKILLAWE